jgi:hypothetical protein
MNRGETFVAALPVFGNAAKGAKHPVRDIASKSDCEQGQDALFFAIETKAAIAHFRKQGPGPKDQPRRAIRQRRPANYGLSALKSASK